MLNRINNPYDNQTWERMAAIKSRILRIWDTAATGVRICCIKFAQRVVLVQTVGPEADPRVWRIPAAAFDITNITLKQRGDPLEVSLSMVPPNHILIPPRNLEAEASGLLDRMLSVFQESIRCVHLLYLHSTLLTIIAMPFLLMPL
jgi:symplekin